MEEAEAVLRAENPARQILSVLTALVVLLALGACAPSDAERQD